MAVSGIFTPRNTPKRHRRALQPFPPCQRFDVCRIRRQSIRRPFDRGEHRTPRHHRTRRPCRDRAPMIPATRQPRNRSGLSAISGKPSAVAIYPATSNAAPPSNAATAPRLSAISASRPATSNAAPPSNAANAPRRLSAVRQFRQASGNAATVPANVSGNRSTVCRKRPRRIPPAVRSTVARPPCNRRNRSTLARAV